tara:strand:+ start:515 stop:778 length:264 start_codon:yes stop_codon:yes gene_type:complete
VEVEIFVLLHEQPHRIHSATSIARKIERTYAGVHTVIKYLQSKGYVKIINGYHKTRGRKRNRVVLTSKGVELAKCLIQWRQIVNGKH